MLNLSNTKIEQASISSTAQIHMYKTETIAVFHVPAVWYLTKNGMSVMGKTLFCKTECA